MPVPEVILYVSFALILVSGANARFARWLTTDEVGEPWRRFWRDRYGYQSWQAKWAKCPWCLGFWSAAPATVLGWFPIMGLQMWWLIVPAWFAVAHATGRWNQVHGCITAPGK